MSKGRSFRWHVADRSRFWVRQQKRLSPKLFCSWLIEGDAVRCQREAGHHRPSTGVGADHVVICAWYRPVSTALVDGLEASATCVALWLDLPPANEAKSAIYDCLVVKAL